jgi:hypothetical protein
MLLAQVNNYLTMSKSAVNFRGCKRAHAGVAIHRSSRRTAVRCCACCLVIVTGCFCTPLNITIISAAYTHFQINKKKINPF